MSALRVSSWELRKGRRRRRRRRAKCAAHVLGTSFPLLPSLEDEGRRESVAAHVGGKMREGEKKGKRRRRKVTIVIPLVVIMDSNSNGVLLCCCSGSE